MKRSQQLSFVRQRGYSVVELLIAGTLGLVLLAGIGSLFLGSSQSFRMQRQLADIQDSGRFALWMFRQELQKAGWRGGEVEPNTANVYLAPPATSGESDRHIENMPINFCPAAGCSIDGVGTIDDSITIGYDDNVDCTGAAVATGHVYNRYFIQNRQLMCAGSGGGAAQPLIDDVDGFQVLYGVDVLNGAEAAVDARLNCLDRVVDEYVTADAVGTSLVIAVRFSLLIAGESNRSITNTERQYQVGDQQYSFTDQIPRRVFSLTVPVRNAGAGLPACPTSLAL